MPETNDLRILFVSQGILPFTGASAFVTESLVNNFRQEELVVIGEKVMFLGKLKRDKNKPKFYYAYTNLTFKGKGKRFFLLFRWLFFFPYLLIKMQWIYRKHKCNYVFGTFPDNYYLTAAYFIARFNNAGFSSYFHNTYLENRPKGTYHWYAARLQPRVFKFSDYVFVMSDGVKAYYDKTYPEIKKFTPLLHTFEAWPPENKRDLFSTKKTYEMVLIGTFNESNAEATSRVINALKTEPQYHIKMFTHVPGFLLRQKGINIKGIDYRGFVAQERFMSELQDNDVCLLTHGFTGGYSRAEYETIFPTRTIQYLISGVPIFAHAPDFSFLARTLQQYDAAEVVTEADPEAVKQRMKAFIENPERRKRVTINARKLAERYYGPNVAEELKEKLSSVAAH